MKRLLVLFGAIAVIPAWGYINELEVADVDTLQEQGFSRSMAEVVDTARYHNTGKRRRYERVFTNKGHKHFGKSYSYIKQYFDPNQDDGLFGEHQINFTNTWNGDNTRYSSERKAKTKVDNL